MRVKNPEIREAILFAASREFAAKGYVKATIGNIARHAGTSPSNVYVYFQSKLEITMAIYEPWFKEQILQLEQDLITQSLPEQKLRTLLERIWKDIPRHHNGMTTTLIQALATATPGDNYNSKLLHWTENRLSNMLAEIFSDIESRQQSYTSMAHMIMLTFDGVGIQQNLKQPVEQINKMIDAMVGMMYQSEH